MPHVKEAKLQGKSLHKPARTRQHQQASGGGPGRTRSYTLSLRLTAFLACRAFKELHPALRCLFRPDGQKSLTGSARLRHSPPSKPFSRSFKDWPEAKKKRKRKLSRMTLKRRILWRRKRNLNISHLVAQRGGKNPQGAIYKAY